jgi:hypothetical protein
MAIYKRGDTYWYWYQFQFNGERIQESAKTSNKDAARQIEAAHRVRLAKARRSTPDRGRSPRPACKGQAGIVERPPAPTLKEFSPQFESAI